MNATIGAIVREQRQWWLRFQQSPPHRVAMFQPLTRPADAPQYPHEPRRYIRHRVHGVISNLDSLNNASDLSGEPIRCFDTFIAAIDTTFGRCKLDPSRRVLMTVAALRGLGKGTFMSAFSTRRGLQLYQKAAWGSHKNVQLSGTIFVNLSFSTEIGSVLDMLIDALNTEAFCVRQGGGGSADDITSFLKKINGAERLVSRVTRLREGGRRYTEASNDVCLPSGRVAV